MKKLIVVMMALGLAFGASAQRGHGGGRIVYHSAPRVIVGVGAYSPFYSPYYYGFGFGYPFSPFGYPYAYPGYGYGRESRLDLQIEDIRTDYRHQIQDVRHDKSLTRSERKAKIRDLKYQREKEITQTKRDFYDRSHRRYNNNGTQPNQNNTQPSQAPQNQQQQPLNNQ